MSIGSPPPEPPVLISKFACASVLLFTVQLKKFIPYGLGETTEDAFMVALLGGLQAFKAQHSINFDDEELKDGTQNSILAQNKDFTPSKGIEDSIDQEVRHQEVRQRAATREKQVINDKQSGI